MELQEKTNKRILELEEELKQINLNIKNLDSKLDPTYKALDSLLCRLRTVEICIQELKQLSN